MKKIVANIPHGLMAKLGRVLGINFFDLQKDGRVSPDTIARMQKHCDACPEPNACARKLERSHNRLEAPPEFCPNYRLLMAIKDMD